MINCMLDLQGLLGVKGSGGRALLRNWVYFSHLIGRQAWTSSEVPGAVISLSQYKIFGLINSFMSSSISNSVTRFANPGA